MGVASIRNLPRACIATERVLVRPVTRPRPLYPPSALVSSACTHPHAALGTWRIVAVVVGDAHSACAPHRDSHGVGCPAPPLPLRGTWTVPLSGRALNIWLHTHEGLGYRETWVVEGSAGQLGLSNLPWAQDTWANDCSFVRVPTVPISAIKISILEALRENTLGIRCMGARTATYSPSAGDVQTEWQCFRIAEQYVKGEKLTNIAFFDPDESDAHLGHGVDASHIPKSVLVPHSTFLALSLCDAQAHTALLTHPHLSHHSQSTL